jgi:hypothetical protein
MTTGSENNGTSRLDRIERIVARAIEANSNRVIEPDTEAIRAALDAGETLPFARLGERATSIRIK